MAKHIRRRARTATGQFAKNAHHTKSARTRTAHGRAVVRRAKERHHKYGRFQYNKKGRPRRNPSIARGMGGQLMAAARDAAVITVAQAATNKVASLIPVGGTSPAILAAKQAAVGLGLAMVTRRFAPRYAHQVLVGALLSPLQTVVSQLPVIGPALRLPATAGLSAYVRPRIGAYVPWSDGNAPTAKLGSYLDIAASRAAYYQ